MGAPPYAGLRRPVKVATKDPGTRHNAAEQAIRFIVIDRHVTQGPRSANGQRANERLWTVIATCAFQGRSVFELIIQAVQAHYQDALPPSLLTGPSR